MKDHQKNLTANNVPRTKRVRFNLIKTFNLCYWMEARNCVVQKMFVSANQREHTSKMSAKRDFVIKQFTNRPKSRHSMSMVVFFGRFHSVLNACEAHLVCQLYWLPQKLKQQSTLIHFTALVITVARIQLYISLRGYQQSHKT